MSDSEDFSFDEFASPISKGGKKPSLKNKKTNICEGITVGSPSNIDFSTANLLKKLADAKSFPTFYPDVFNKLGFELSSNNDVVYPDDLSNKINWSYGTCKASNVYDSTKCEYRYDPDRMEIVPNEDFQKESVSYKVLDNNHKCEYRYDPVSKTIIPNYNVDSLSKKKIVSSKSVSKRETDFEMTVAFLLLFIKLSYLHHILLSQYGFQPYLNYLFLFKLALIMVIIGILSFNNKSHNYELGRSA